MEINAENSIYLDGATSLQINNAGLHKSFEGLSEKGINILQILEEVNNLIENSENKIELNENTSIRKLFQKILENKKSILKALEKNGNLDLKINTNISDEDFFSTLMYYLATTRSSSGGEIKIIKQAYFEYKKSKIQDITNLQKDTLLSKTNKRSIGEEKLDIILSKVENPKQSKLILNYLNRDPENHQRILYFIEQTDIETVSKTIKKIDDDKVVLVIDIICGIFEIGSSFVQTILESDKIIKTINNSVDDFHNLKNSFGIKLMINLINTLSHKTISEIGIDELLKYKIDEIEKLITFYNKQNSTSNFKIPSNLKLFLQIGIDNAEAIVNKIGNPNSIPIIEAILKSKGKDFNIAEVIKYYRNIREDNDKINKFIDILLDKGRLPKKTLGFLGMY